MEPRSLFFMGDDAFTKYLHGIKMVKEDVITEKVFNRPDYLKVGDVVPRTVRYSNTTRRDGKRKFWDKKNLGKLAFKILIIFIF
jgi:hypothetical protein